MMGYFVWEPPEINCHPSEQAVSFRTDRFYNT